MKVNIICVGKIKEKYISEGIAEYQKRLSKFCDIKIIEVDEFSQEKSITKKIASESNLIIEKLSGFIITLDRNGQELSSEQIAQKIEKIKLLGKSEIKFVIGGSNGVSKDLLQKSDLLLSFGKVTYPHQLFRLILIEQIYRAFSIIEGLPYHK